MSLQFIFSGQFLTTNLTLKLDFFMNTLNMFRETRLVRKQFITNVTRFHYFRYVMLLLLNK